MDGIHRTGVILDDSDEFLVACTLGRQLAHAQFGRAVADYEPRTQVSVRSRSDQSNPWSAPKPSLGFTEGIADQIDKAIGYEKYYSEVIRSIELSEIMINLYNQAEDDLKKLQNIIVSYSKGEISENDMIDDGFEK